METPKFIHATTLDKLKAAYATTTYTNGYDNPEIAHSIGITDDGHLVTHGVVFNFLGTNSSSISNLITVSGDSTYISIDKSGIDNKVKHNTFITAGSIGPSADNSSSITVPKITYNAAGHITATTTYTATLNKVKMTSDTTTDSVSNYLLIGKPTTSGLDYETYYNSNIYANLKNGALHATTLYEGANAISSLYASKSAYETHTTTTATNSVLGHVKLIADNADVSNTSGASSGVAATPNFVNRVIANMITANDAMRFAGTVDGTEKIVSHNSTVNTASITDGTTTFALLTDYHSGDTWKVTSAGSVAGQAVENGDILICIKDYATAYNKSDWTIVQNNIDGAVTSAGTLSGILYGDNGTRAIKALSFGKNGYVLLSTGSGIEFNDKSTLWRTIKIGGTSIGTNEFNIAAGAGISISASGGTATISNSYNSTLTITDGSHPFSYSPSNTTTLTFDNTLFSINATSKTISHAAHTSITTLGVYSITADTSGHITAATALSPLLLAITPTNGTATTYKAYNATNSTVSILSGNGITITKDKDTDAYTFAAKESTLGLSTVTDGAKVTLTSGNGIADNISFILGGATTITLDATAKTITISSANTWRNIRAYVGNGVHEISSLTTHPLTFSSDFILDPSTDDGLIYIGWVDIAADGTKTYTH